MEAMCCRFGGGPVGLSTLAVSVGEATETVEDVYEPFLLQLGMLMRTPRGPGGDALGLGAPRAYNRGAEATKPVSPLPGLDAPGLDGAGPPSTLWS